MGKPLHTTMDKAFDLFLEQEIDSLIRHFEEIRNYRQDWPKDENILERKRICSKNAEKLMEVFLADTTQTPKGALAMIKDVLIANDVPYLDYVYETIADMFDKLCGLHMHKQPTVIKNLYGLGIDCQVTADSILESRTRLWNLMELLDKNLS